MSESQYSEYFKPELDAMDVQATDNDKLYKEVHKALEKNLERIDGKAMFGSSSPYKDIAQLGDTLNDIRGNQVTIIKEKANIKKNIIDLDIRKENSKSQSTDANVNQVLMRDILSNLRQQVPNLNKPTHQEMVDNRGKETLKNLDPDKLGINANDLQMIDRFKGRTK